VGSGNGVGAAGTLGAGAVAAAYPGGSTVAVIAAEGGGKKTGSADGVEGSEGGGAPLDPPGRYIGAGALGSNDMFH